eukprot:1193667-Prorocentrum_minimum.AAC.2
MCIMVILCIRVYLDLLALLQDSSCSHFYRRQAPGEPECIRPLNVTNTGSYICGSKFQSKPLRGTRCSLWKRKFTPITTNTQQQLALLNPKLKVECSKRHLEYNPIRALSGVNTGMHEDENALDIITMPTARTTNFSKIRECSSNKSQRPTLSPYRVAVSPPRHCALGRKQGSR